MPNKLTRGLAISAFAFLTWLSVGEAQNVVTERYNNARTGSTLQSLPGGKLASTWGKKGELPVQGRVYAQPLYVQQVQTASGLHNMVFVATEENRVYGFDADSLALVWTLNLGQNDSTKIRSGCDVISPDGIGIESTPVIDVASQRMYVSYRLNPQQLVDSAQQMVAAIDIRTGQKVLGPTQITHPGWVPRLERNRASLLLLNGMVYVAFSSRCEDPGQPIFHGSIVAMDANTLMQASFLPITDDVIDGGGIWQGSSGLAADATDIYAMTGNRRLGLGTQPDSTPNYADSILRIHPQLTQGVLQLSVADWFTPYRKLWMDANDLDLGSAGPTLIPGSNYLVGGGKEGLLYVVDTTNMGKQDTAKSWSQANLQALKPDATQDQFPDDPTADHVAQKFQVGSQQYIPAVPNYLAPAGAPVAVGLQNGNQVDLFNVGRDGAVYVTSQAASGAWTDGQDGRAYAVAITPPIARPGAFVASAQQTSTQLDAFVAGTNGAVYVTAVAGLGAWSDGLPGHGSPAMITPNGVTPSGACLTAAFQTATQLDVFYVGNNGSVYVTAVAGTGAWSDGSAGRLAPAAITPPNFATPGACIAAAKQTPTQLDVFVVNKNNGAVYVTSVVGVGSWTDGGPGKPSPAAITPTGFASPNASIAAASQSPTQLDVFVPGLDGAVHVTSVVGTGQWTSGAPGAGSPSAITPPNSTLPTGGVSAANQTPNQLDVFYVAANGSVMVTSVVNEGRWTDGVNGDPPPIAVSTAFTQPGASLISTAARAGQLQVFAIGRNGGPYMTAELENGPWMDGLAGRPGAQELTRAVWMGDWFNWSHIHGGPVFAAFPDGTARLYVWPEKDHLKSFPWIGTRVDVNSKVLGKDQTGALILDPDGMPGGMLGTVIDSASPHSGVLFASVSQTPATDGPGILRAFDALTLQQIWNNQGENYQFSKFVPFTFANGRMYLPTASNKVIVYGP